MQTAVTMRQVTGSMANVVKGMDSAMKAMDLEKAGLLEGGCFGIINGLLTGGNLETDFRCHGQV